jgi:hypothetical protein
MATWVESVVRMATRTVTMMAAQQVVVVVPVDQETF